jgi:hypothetical protein
MAITISGTDGIVGAGFTVDNSGVSVTAGVGTFSSVRGTHHGDGANLTSIPAANIVGLATAGFNRSGGFPEGVTTAYQFRLTSGLTLSNSTLELTANWEKIDNTGQGNLGTFADPSSGVFTFPSTGIYLVRFNGYFEDSGDSPKSTLNILVTHNNGSDWSTVASVNSSNSNLDTYTYSAGSVESLVDVTDTSNVKVKFSAFNHSASLDGSSTQNRTYVTFIRLGDT